MEAVLDVVAGTGVVLLLLATASVERAAGRLALVAAVAAGLGKAFGGPAYQALIPSLVPKRHLPNAIALLSIQFNRAGTVGRPIGGVVFELLGPAMCFFLNSLSFLAVMVSLLLLRLPSVKRAGDLAPDAAGGAGHQRRLSRQIEHASLP